MLEVVNISDLRINFKSDAGLVKAVNGIDLVLYKGDILGLLGESGSGKTVLGSAILKLLPKDIQIKGKIDYKGNNMVSIDSRKLRNMRINELGVIMQNPSNSLNPSITIGNQIAEVFTIKEKLSRKEAMAKTINLLRKVKISEPEKRAKEYPHQFSGGMKERAIIAMGVAGNPDFILADEPTKGLDTIVKHSIVKLLKEVSKDKTMMMITHDLDVAKNVCNKIGIMYLGEIVELTTVDQIFEKQLHPYTRAFFDAMPSRGMKPIKGYPRSLIDIPKGCRFFDRCDYCMEICKEVHPPMVEIEKGRKVRCFLHARGKESK